MRQPAIKIDPRPALKRGDKVQLASSVRSWRVKGVTAGGRFAILTQPFNLQRTVLYTVIDFDRGVRGKDDHYGLGYESPTDIRDAVHQFQHTEDDDPPEVTNECRGVSGRGDWCIGSVEVSHRSANHVRDQPPRGRWVVSGERFQYAIRLPDGRLITDPDWHTPADVMRGAHGHGVTAMPGELVVVETTEESA